MVSSMFSDNGFFFFNYHLIKELMKSIFYAWQKKKVVYGVLGEN